MFVWSWRFQVWLVLQLYNWGSRISHQKNCNRHILDRLERHYIKQSLLWVVAWSWAVRQKIQSVFQLHWMLCFQVLFGRSRWCSYLIPNINSCSINCGCVDGGHCVGLGPPYHGSLLPLQYFSVPILNQQSTIGYFNQRCPSVVTCLYYFILLIASAACCYLFCSYLAAFLYFVFLVFGGSERLQNFHRCHNDCYNC